jgi:hypothetical protein
LQLAVYNVDTELVFDKEELAFLDRDEEQHEFRNTAIAIGKRDKNEDYELDYPKICCCYSFSLSDFSGTVP